MNLKGMSGGIWSRRQLLRSGAFAGGASLLRRGALIAERAPKQMAHALSPEQVEGPYYIDAELLRRDIREGRTGVPMHLHIAVLDGRTGAPLPHAAVDVWHCDAMGIYSGYEQQSLGPGGPPGEAGPDGMPPRGAGDRPAGPPRDAQGRPIPPPGGFGGPGGGPPPHSHISDNDRFLRGVQIADARGTVDFLTIYPGWYQGRDTHIHVKVHVDGREALGRDRTLTSAASSTGRHVYAGGHVCYTGQIAFDDTWSDRIAKLKPYRDHNLQRTLLSEDGVFGGHGKEMMARLVQMQAEDLAAGVSGNMVFTVDPSVTWKEDFNMPAGLPPSS